MNKNNTMTLGPLIGERRSISVNREGPIKADADVTKAMFGILKTEEAIELERERLKAEVKLFTDMRQDEIRKLQNRVNFWKGQIEQYLNQTGQKSINTPAGRAGFRRRKVKEWADDQTLIAFSKQEGIPLRNSERPIKKDIESYLREHPELIQAPILPTDPIPVLKEREVDDFVCRPMQWSERSDQKVEENLNHRC